MHILGLGTIHRFTTHFLLNKINFQKGTTKNPKIIIIIIRTLGKSCCNYQKVKITLPFIGLDDPDIT